MRSIFVVTGAFVGRIESSTRIAFWTEDPTEHDFDASRLVSVDVSRTPNAAASREISWDAVEVDDCWTAGTGNLAGTTIGGQWPEVNLTGAVYLEKSLMDRLPAAARPTTLPKQVDGRDYELQAVVYWSVSKDLRAGRRYMGHHAEILEERGHLARVAVYKAGSSRQEGARPMIMWLDLTAIDQCDAGPKSMTTIGVGDAPKKGALFLPCGMVIDASEKRDPAPTDTVVVSSPKVPPLQGDADATEGPKIPRVWGDAQAASSAKMPKQYSEASWKTPWYYAEPAWKTPWWQGEPAWKSPWWLGEPAWKTPWWLGE